MLLLRDTEPGVSDHISHFRVGRGCHDENYQRGGGKLLLQAWKLFSIMRNVVSTWIVEAFDGVAKQEGEGVGSILVKCWPESPSKHYGRGGIHVFLLSLSQTKGM